MKKLLVVFFVFILSFSIISFVQVKQDNLDNGFYYLSENEKDSKLVNDINPNYDFVYGIEKNPILTSNDFLDVNISNETCINEKSDDRAIDINLNESGRKKWRIAKKILTKSNESFVLIFENKVILVMDHCSHGKLELLKIHIHLKEKNVKSFCSTINQEIENYKFKNSKK